MIKRLYVDNFKCLQKFELNLENLNSAFLLGKNGSGKTTLFEVIEIFQKIGHGTTYVEKIFDKNSFSYSDLSKSIYIQLEVEIAKRIFKYDLTIDYVEKHFIFIVKKESLCVNDKQIFSRKENITNFSGDAKFSLDWQHIALPLISTRRSNEPTAIFRDWLKSIIILSPYPKDFLNKSQNEDSKLKKDGSNIIDFSRWLLTDFSLYSNIMNYLKSKMPDLETFKLNNTGKDEKELVFEFSIKSRKQEFNFSQLSDGEKIFFLAATILAAQKNTPNLLCLWDEPDNFIGLKEMNGFIMEFRKAFEDTSSQLIMTSHNERAINRFSNHNTFVLSRNSHLAPTKVKVLKDIEYLSSTVTDAFENDELEIE